MVLLYKTDIPCSKQTTWIYSSNRWAYLIICYCLLFKESIVLHNVYCFAYGRLICSMKRYPGTGSIARDFCKHVVYIMCLAMAWTIPRDRNAYGVGREGPERFYQPG